MSTSDPPVEPTSSIDLSEFAQAFFEEVTEHLANMEKLLLAIDPSMPSDEDLNAIFRAAHSIKGGSSMFGFDDMTGLTHELESLLDKIRKRELGLTAGMVDILLEAGDTTRLMSAFHSGTSDQEAPPADHLCDRLRRLQSPPAHPIAGEPEGANGVAGPAASGRDAEDAFDREPESQSEVRADHTIATGVPATASDRSVPFGQSANARPESERTAGSEHLSIRVHIEKVDQLINQLGEVVITQAMLTESISRLDPVINQRLFKCMADLERNTRDLQQSVMSIRMAPVSAVFSRTPRMVRDLATKLGKKVQVVMQGESTELDKGLIEKISDPLTHLVRNSVDHGIETPDLRIAAGKADVGTVILRAFHQGGSIVIEICDDGAGLNREKILSKALEQGLPVSKSMSDSEVWQLIFEAGFSTAERVTDVSGRGVGMDVVKRNIHSLGGRVEIDSQLGIGTRITIRLPLTLAILDGLSVSATDQLYIIPLSFIVESLQPKASDVKSISSLGQVIRVRGEYLPIVNLHDVFSITHKVADIEQGIIVIIEADGIKKALFVDQLIGQHQVVIKSLETNYRKVEGISGATIMGDGKVALIIDAGAIVRMTTPELLAAA